MEVEKPTKTKGAWNKVDSREEDLTFDIASKANRGSLSLKKPREGLQKNESQDSKILPTIEILSRFVLIKYVRRSR